MNWLNLTLAIISWLSILALQFILMNIALFFEKNSGKSTWYQGYLAPLFLSALGAGRYLTHLISGESTYNFTGDPLANIALFCAGLILIVLGTYLYDQMMGDHRAL